jgi:2-amino-4-hydroxy-6-hydroxymethyldihydropteridine diphosphokinase
MIYIGLGGNLAFENMSVPATLQAAIGVMPSFGVTPNKISHFYRTRPVPVSDQPWFVNAVVACTCELAPPELLRALLTIEETFGRVRSVKNAARTLDLDILDYHGKIFSDDMLALPHPHLASRAFVLLPLRDVAPDWKHPVTGSGIATLIAQLNADDRTSVVRVAR